MNSTLTNLKEFKNELENFVAPPNTEGWSLSNLPTHFWETIGECINDIQTHINNETKQCNNKLCYCGSEVDTSNPDCVDFNLCKNHSVDV